MRRLSKIVVTLLFSSIGFGVLASGEDAKNANEEFIVTDKMRMETQYIVAALEKTHFNNLTIATLDGRQLIKDYLNDLDLNHSFFTQEQVSSFLSRFGSTMTVYLKQGNIYPGFEIYKTYRDNVLNRAEWISKKLDKPFQFDTNVKYTPVRKELPWPKNDKAANELWEMRLKYEVLNEILSLSREAEKKAVKEQKGEKTADVKTGKDETHKEAIENIRKRYKLIADYISEVEPSEVQEIFLTTYAKMYDPHSNFMSSDSLEEISMSLHKSLVGIGAYLTVTDETVTIKELIPGGPAEASRQLGNGDQILGVAQDEKGKMVDIVGMKLKKAVRHIRGKEGTVVRLLIKPAGDDPSARKVVRIVREKIRLTSNLAQAKLYEVEHKGKDYRIGVIDIPAFYGPNKSNSEDPSTSGNVNELIQKLKKYDVQGLVLDLRRNGGGLLYEAIDLTGLFIPIGPVVHVKDEKGNIREFLDTDPSIAWEGPLLILVSRYSASASEIFAGALKSYDRAIIVGDSHTYGKGTVQLLTQISPPMVSKLLNKTKRSKLGATNLTIQKWYLPDGSSTQVRGVASHIQIPSINEHLPITESDLDNALEWDTINILPWNYDNLSEYADSIDKKSMSFLESESAKRQETWEEFEYLTTNIDRFRVKQEMKEYSLNLKAREIQRKEDKKVRTEMVTWLKKLAKGRYESQDVLLDIVAEAQDRRDSDTMTTEQIHGSLKEVDEESEEELPIFDVYTRESLRIMADYITYKGGIMEKSANATKLARSEAKNVTETGAN